MSKTKFKGKDMHVEITVKHARPIDKVQFDKAWQDAKEGGFGIYDRRWGIRIDPSDLIFVSPCGKVSKNLVRHRAALMANLATIERIYRKKFGSQSSMSLDLFESNIGDFIERLIRSVEICTLRYALNVGGALNATENMWIIKGRQSFLWETGKWEFENIKVK